MRNSNYQMEKSSINEMFNWFSKKFDELANHFSILIEENRGLKVKFVGLEE